MANPLIEELRAEVARNTSVDASAKALIEGIRVRIQKAVDKALENGATAEELAPLAAELAALKTSNADLVAAVTANTDEDDATPPEPEARPGAGKQAQAGGQSGGNRPASTTGTGTSAPSQRG